MSKTKVIAFYLPQYHPTPDNDKWWGKGFTEWTNVGKAKPMFHGHYQPKVPADLGYYDLRLPQVREAQVELAKEAGIYGFCYYHYWFGNGKEELELPFNEVLRLGKPDFPFMLCWANESWHKKFWNKDGKGSSKEVLIEQIYPGEKDHIDHFYRLLPAFKDKRYIRIDGKIAFMIYKPFEFPELESFLELWNTLAKKEGLEGFTFIANLNERFSTERIDWLLSQGFNYINTVRLLEGCSYPDNIISRAIHKIYRIILKKPFVKDYSKFLKKIINKEDLAEKIIPTIIPNWDHTPRSKNNGIVIKNSTPQKFKEYCQNFFSLFSNKKYVFLKSWNEWGEGNYMEPDLKYGKGFIETLSKYTKKLQ